MVFALSSFPINAQMWQNAIVVTPAIPMQAETTALLAAFSVQPSALRILAINQLIYNLKLEGIWSSLDICYDGTAETSQQALINWITPGSFTGTGNGTYTQNPNIGWKFDGSTGYIDTGWNPSVDAVHLTATDAALLVYDNTNPGALSQIDFGVAAANFLEINGRSTSNNILGPVNVTSSANAAGPGNSVLTSVGTAIASRSGSTTSWYHNGVSVGSYAPASSGLPTATMTIGARNTGGARDTFSSKVISFVCAGANIPNAQNFHGVVQAYINKVAPNPSIIYVSNNVGNGLPVGSDTTGVGSLSAPLLTIDAGLAAAGDGQIVSLNCDAGHHATYSSSAATITLTTNTGITAPAAGCATVNSTGGNQVITLSPTAGQTITLGPIIIDAQTTANYCEFFTSETTPFTVNHTGTQCLNPVIDGYHAQGLANDNHVLTFSGGGMSGTSSQACVTAFAAAGGSFSFSNGWVCAITNLATASRGGILIQAADIGGATITLPISIDDAMISIGIDAAAPAGFYNGISIKNIPSAQITNNNITISGHVSGTQGVPIVITPVQYFLGFILPAFSGNFVVSGNTVVNTTDGGYGIQVAQDGASVNALGLGNGGVVFNNDISGDATAATNGVHGVLTGGGNDTIVHNNTCHTLGFCVGDKYGNGAISYDNMGWDLYGRGIIIRGSTNFTSKHDTFIGDQSGSISAMIELQDANDAGPVVHSTGAIFLGGIWMTHGFNGPFVKVAANNQGNFSYNNYYGDAGSPASNAWSYQGVNYTFTNWNAIIEPSAKNVDPNLVNGATPSSSADLDLAGPGVNSWVPYSSAVPLDFFGLAFKQPLSAIGAAECYAGGC
jgi:hypothetical protein